MKASEIIEPGWYWWRPEKGFSWKIMYVLNLNFSNWNYGEFIGPIPEPEEE